MPNPSSPSTEERVIAFWIGPFQPLAFSLHQITPGGAILESHILWEIGEDIPLELWFPGEVRQRAKARVAGPVKQPMMGMLIAFIDLSPSAQGALGRYLARQGEP
jgi:hypothetical protein